jgi:hypothetical protein
MKSENGMSMVNAPQQRASSKRLYYFYLWAYASGFRFAGGFKQQFVNFGDE